MSSNVNQKIKKDETSLKRVLKKVLKQAEYNKLMPVIDFLDSNDSISVQDVINITGKSRTTAWRYLNLPNNIVTPENARIFQTVSS